MRVRLASGSRLVPAGWLKAFESKARWGRLVLRVGLGSQQMSVIVWVGWFWHLAAGRKSLKGRVGWGRLVPAGGN